MDSISMWDDGAFRATGSSSRTKHITPAFCGKLLPIFSGAGKTL
ncbi:MAG TPA: hypothetical protein PKV73_06720 [Agriterribacter sp.]|nr:hypothetical protein [Agriterribacter sp.]